MSNDRTEPGVRPRCGDTRLIPIGDGYSVNPCPNCTMFHQQQPAQPLYDSLGRCINFRDVHPAQPCSGEVKRYVGRITELEPSPVQHVVLASDFERLQSALTEAEKKARRWNIYRDGGDLLICFDAHEKCEYVRYVPYLALTAAQQRIAELERDLENERARGIHTCHDQCQRPLCVANRRIAALESGLSEAIEIMTRGERLLPEGEARLRQILEGKEPS